MMRYGRCQVAMCFSVVMVATSSTFFHLLEFNQCCYADLKYITCIPLLRFNEKLTNSVALAEQQQKNLVSVYYFNLNKQAVPFKK